MWNFIWDLIVGTSQPDKYSWIDLDDFMRRKLRKAAVVAVLFLLALIGLSLYFYIQLPPLREVVSSLSGSVAQSIKDKGDIPGWILWAGGVLFAVLLALSGLFAWALVDFGRMHRKIDRLTFRLTPRVGKHIITATRTVLGCPNTRKCELKRQAATRQGKSKILKECFYHFANKDVVGDYNQAEQRRLVFIVWTHYYLSNFFFLYLLLLSLWGIFITYIKARWWVTLLPVALMLLIIFLWRRRGRKYWPEVRDLADEQVKAFHRFDKQKFVDNAKSVIPACSEPLCPLH